MAKHFKALKDGVSVETKQRDVRVLNEGDTISEADLADHLKEALEAGDERLGEMLEAGKGEEKETPRSEAPAENPVHVVQPEPEDQERNINAREGLETQEDSKSAKDKVDEAWEGREVQEVEEKKLDEAAGAPDEGHRMPETETKRTRRKG